MKNDSVILIMHVGFRQSKTLACRMDPPKGKKRNKSMNILNPRILESWNSGILEFWNSGILESGIWNSEI
jgi:hypothetical protein